MGRPSDYAPEIAEEICRRLGAGETLLTICAEDGMPDRRTIQRWVDQHEEFRRTYAQAREQGAHAIAEEALKIANTPLVGVKEVDKFDRLGNPITETSRGDMIEHRRLQVDTRKWYAGQINQKAFGARQSIEHSGPDGGPIEIDDRTRAAKIEAIFAAAARIRDSGADLV